MYDYRSVVLDCSKFSCIDYTALWVVYFPGSRGSTRMNRPNELGCKLYSQQYRRAWMKTINRYIYITGLWCWTALSSRV